MDPSDEKYCSNCDQYRNITNLLTGVLHGPRLSMAPVGASVQDLQVDPTDYNIQYAGVNSNGIAKSTDAGKYLDYFFGWNC